MRVPASGSPHSTVDVLVVGAGIVGLSAARSAASAGATVVVLDPSPGGGATHAAAGMLAAVTEADVGESHLAAMNVDSAARWPAFAAELEAASGVAVGLRRTGTLELAYDTDDAVALRRLVDLRRRWGLDAAAVTPADARRRAPLVGRVAGAAWAPHDHQVDPRAVHRALLAALVPGDGGAAEVVARSAVRLSLSRPGGRVDGVLDDAGRTWRAGVVVLAAGDRSPALVRDLPEVRVPVRPVKGMTLRLEADEWFDVGPVLRARVQGRPVYVVTREPVTGTDGRTTREVVVGATSDERPDDRRVETGGVFALLRDARAVLPAIDETALVGATPRVRPTTPDNVPLLGPTAVPGLVLTTGHGRNGVLLAPLTAAVVADVLAGRPVPASALAADPRRFDPRRSDAMPADPRPDRHLTSDLVHGTRSTP